MPGEGGTSWVGRLAKLIGTAGVGVLGYLALVLGPDLLAAIDRGLVRAWVSGFLQVVMGLELVVVGVAGLSLLVMPVLWSRVRRRGESGRVYLGGLAVGMASLVGVGVLEVGAWAVTRGGEAGASVAEAPLIGAAPKLPRDLPTGRPGELRILMLGESTAVGLPFAPQTSIGQVVAWKLQEVFPERKVVLEMMAASGCTLRHQVERVATLDRRPDVVLLYSGHNEFQSRFPLMRTVDYYPEDRAERPKPLHERLAGWTPLLAWIHRLIERQSIDILTGVYRTLVDRPVCSEGEYRLIRESYHRDLESLAGYFEELGAVCVFFVPAGNQSGCGPNRSVMPSTTTKWEREAFEGRVRLALAVRESNPDQAEAALRALIDEQPRFAESHWRLGRLLRKSGRDEEAAFEFDRACDLDGLPVRCPGDFRTAYQEVASRHEVIVIDANAEIRRLDPHGQLGDLQFLDIHHPGLPGYLMLAQQALNALKERGAMGWPEGRPAPRIDPDRCARHFGIDRERWAAVAITEGGFNYHFSGLRYDRTHREVRSEILETAASRIRKGISPEQAGAEGLGVHPPGLRELSETMTAGR